MGDQDEVSPASFPTLDQPHRRIDTSNRRAAAAVYLGAATIAILLVLSSGLAMLWVTAVTPLLLVALYNFVAGRPMTVSDTRAIKVASDAVSFEVGHASTTLGFRGITAKPVWQVLVFEEGKTPNHQALVTVDAISGTVTGTYAELVELP